MCSLIDVFFQYRHMSFQIDLYMNWFSWKFVSRLRSLHRRPSPSSHCNDVVAANMGIYAEVEVRLRYTLIVIVKDHRTPVRSIEPSPTKSHKFIHPLHFRIGQREVVLQIRCNT